MQIVLKMNQGGGNFWLSNSAFPYFIMWLWSSRSLFLVPKAKNFLTS